MSTHEDFPVSFWEEHKIEEEFRPSDKGGALSFNTIAKAVQKMGHYVSLTWNRFPGWRHREFRLATAVSLSLSLSLAYACAT